MPAATRKRAPGGAGRAAGGFPDPGSSRPRAQSRFEDLPDILVRGAAQQVHAVLTAKPAQPLEVCLIAQPVIFPIAGVGGTDAELSPAVVHLVPAALGQLHFEAVVNVYQYQVVVSGKSGQMMSAVLVEIAEIADQTQQASWACFQ